MSSRVVNQSSFWLGLWWGSITAFIAASPLKFNRFRRYLVRVHLPQGQLLLCLFFNGIFLVVLSIGRRRIELNPIGRQYHLFLKNSQISYRDILKPPLRSLLRHLLLNVSLLVVGFQMIWIIFSHFVLIWSSWRNIPLDFVLLVVVIVGGL